MHTYLNLESSKQTRGGEGKGCQKAEKMQKAALSRKSTAWYVRLEKAEDLHSSHVAVRGCIISKRIIMQETH